MNYRNNQQYYEEKDAVSFSSSYEDWAGSADEWREAFFKLLSYKNTFNGFFELTINAYGDHTPYMYMVVDSKKLNVSAIENLLKDLGYNAYTESEYKIRIVDGFDLDDEYDGIWYIE